MTTTNITLQAAIASFPAEFHLKAWGDKIFRVEPRKCFTSGDVHQIVFQVNSNGVWLDFAREDLATALAEVKPPAATRDLTPRQADEMIVRKCVQHLLDLGANLYVSDSDDDSTYLCSQDPQAICEELGAADESLLYVSFDHNGHKVRGCILFVWGNEGAVVIADYSGRLEHILAPIEAYAESLEARILDN
jgi:hypothetical protein